MVERFAFVIVRYNIMKAFQKIMAAVLAVIVGVFVITNYCLLHEKQENIREYRVQVERAARDISEGKTPQEAASQYPLLVKITKQTSAQQTQVQEEADTEVLEKAFLEGGNEDYVIREINGSYYRFDYQLKVNTISSREVVMVNAGLGLMAALVFCILIYIRLRILAPFYQLSELPFELSKGNLHVPLKEEKSRYFGRFVWGMDLLREHLEETKAQELKLQKEKKTLILSVSHDIKTPLSAIKLYAKALSRNLYQDREKQQMIAESINEKADEIERFVCEIIKASREDFLNLTVKNGEFYLSELVRQIRSYYEDKLDFLDISFILGECRECLLKGDLDRAVEVLQNIMENAVKYGDGQEIRIEFADEEDCRLITVSNTGCCLAPYELPHMFESFFRGSNVGNAPGSGLGLYICRQLMNEMDGEIFARCSGEEGTVMSVTVVFQKV